MRRKILYILLVFVLSACTNNKIESQTQPSIIKNDKQSHTDTNILNLSMNPVKTFNPLQNENKSVDKILRLVFEPLIKFDKNGQPVNNLVSQIIFDENYNAAIKLRDDIFWSNGKNLTADDVIFSISQIKSASENTIYKLHAQNIVSYKKTSSHDLIIKFKDSAYASIYLMDFPIIPEKYFFGENENISSVIGDGPYKFSSYTKMKSLILEKNEKYFGDEPEFKNINVIIIPDDETNTNAFNQSVIDLISVNYDDIGKFRNNTNKIFYPTNELEFIFFNPSNNLFNVKQLHNVIINILPINQIKKEIYSNLLSESALDTKIEKISIDQAKEIISEYIKPVSTLKILVNSQNSQRIKAAVLIKKTLATYGINSIIEKKNFEEYKAALKNKNFDIFIGGFAPEKKFNYEKLLGLNNILLYTNKSILENLEQLKLATDNIEFNSTIENLSSSISNDSKIIILGQKKRVVMTNKNICLEESTLVCKFLDH